METAENPSADSRDMELGCPAGVLVKRRRKRGRSQGTKPQLLTRDQLDGRTNAAKLFDRLIADIEADLGGHEQLSTIERALIEAFAGASVTLSHLNTQLALGEKIDLSDHAQAVSAMVRVASRLGLQRRARDVTTPSVAAYVEHINKQPIGEEAAP
jgi:hypothetical protein